MAIYKENGSPVFVEIGGQRFPLRVSKNTVNLSPVHISDDMQDKMQGIPAISTTCKDNEFCKRRRAANKPGHVCPHCFATRIRENTRAALKSNHDLLTAALLPDQYVPVFGNVRVVRIEALGDIENLIQARNYLRIIRKNPRVMFAWWSKNGGLINRALKLEGRPNNVVFVQSSEYLNRAPRPFFSWVDHVFTVYDDPEKATAAGMPINCGGRRCLTCLRCYSKKTGLHVSELLK